MYPYIKIDNLTVRTKKLPKSNSSITKYAYFCSDLLAQLDRATFLRKVWLRVRIPHRNQSISIIYQAGFYFGLFVYCSRQRYHALSLFTFNSSRYSPLPHYKCGRTGHHASNLFNNSFLHLFLNFSRNNCMGSEWKTARAGNDTKNGSARHSVTK